ncbi:fimbrial protein [Pantoea sp. USHLN256]|uniref:fimbrial protein n=1 Tax=Pantoea sp. USHLN256 TaxID=3081293 RepID=UPI0030169AA2
MQIKLSSVFRNMVAAAVVSGISFAASAADGKINFTGTILDSACTIDTNTANQTVNLGKIPKSSFNAAGAVAAATRFSIMLNNCPAAVTSASIKFDGNADSSDTNILALNSGQTAKGVGIAFYEEDGITAIPLATQSKSITLDTSAGEEPANSNKMTFVAKYKAMQASVVAGTANATSDFTITYQ